ncbi:hypothetical protein [Leptolyngbya sp. FACHB-261]|uniref:hypothetical protein n=1 Tax=Leptolyngbya sp. FACHB-261 TaxID=2692806 RepID=UPI001681D367|nr:hypothetical protein [Leptolyngbya sp. FACHB-261]MBD2103070.1 hypothetical protein [Leptolyngbya sp. FACHB-261]
MTQTPAATFNESDFNILLILVERYTLSTVLAALSRICLRQAERFETTQQSRETIREWREDASILTKALIQLNH